MKERVYGGGKRISVYVDAVEYEQFVKAGINISSFVREKIREHLTNSNSEEGLKRKIFEFEVEKQDLINKINKIECEIEKLNRQLDAIKTTKELVEKEKRKKMEQSILTIRNSKRPFDIVEEHVRLLREAGLDITKEELLALAFPKEKV